MSNHQQATALSAPLMSPYGVGFAISALALGGFGIGIGEFAIMGLIPEISSDFLISVPQAGYAISAYALGVVVGAPLLAVFFARVPQKIMLIGLMLAFTVGNFASALSPSSAYLVLFRFLSGLPHGAYFGIASLVASSIVPMNHRARAVGRMMLGVSLSNVIGVPLITFLGQGLTWRMAFSAVALIGLCTVLSLTVFLPRIPVKSGASSKQELRAFLLPQLWLTLLVGAVGFGGMFSVYSYIAPTILDSRNAPIWSVPAVMGIFGIGMVIGSTIGGILVDRSLHLALWGLQIFNILVIGAFYFTGQYFIWASVNILFVGFGVAIVPAMQMRLIEIAKNSQSLAASLNHASLNIGNALGAWLGGIAIAAHFGWTSTGLVGALLGLLGLIIFYGSMMLEKRN